MANFDSARGQEALDEAAKNAGGPPFQKVVFFTIKEDGGKALLRYITDVDEWLTVEQHNFVPTRPKPADWPEGSSWPNTMSATCRNAAVFTNPDGSKDYPDCFICDNLRKPDGKPFSGSRTFAWACEREEVVEGGKVVGYRDKTREVSVMTDEKDSEGKAIIKTITEKAIVLVAQGHKNFYGTLEGFAGHYGTVVDRDYLIKRDGVGKETDYHIIPMDPIMMDGGRKFDLREQEFKDRYIPSLITTLEEFITSKASDEHYALFFDTRMEQPKRQGSSDDSGAAQQAKPSNDAESDERLAALSQRVKGYGAGESAPAEPAQQAEPAAAGGGGMRDFG